MSYAPFAIAFLALPATAQAPPQVDAAAFQERIQPLIAQYCLTCHSTEKHKGDLDLEPFDSLAAVRRQPKIWLEVVDKLGSGEMPPAKAPQPSVAERELLRGFAQAVLIDLAAAHAGDPGPVVLRRLSNAEYTYALRDLTGVASLDPAHEFPVDGAAGEGFTNVGNALVISPVLLGKYLSAGKAIAEHALLLPDGLRFTAAATRRDQTDELLAQIRAFYRRYSDSEGANIVNVQGIVFATNEGGRLPVAQYLEATLALRGTTPDPTALAAAARARDLSPKYLTLLWQMLTSRESSPLLDDLRQRWRRANPGDAAPLVASIVAWQQQLWQFRTVGHIGKVGGPKSWLEPLQPFVASEELHCKLPADDGKDVSLYLVASDAGDGNEHDDVVWRGARLVAPGRPDLPLREVRGLAQSLATRREQLRTSVPACLAAVAEALASPVAVPELAARHGVDAGVLAAWLDWLGVGAGNRPPVAQYFKDAQHDVSGFAAVRGWSSGELPCLYANSSDQEVRIPGTLAGHGVVVHPMPTQRVVVAWQSPQATRVRIAARIQHAHTDCGNGVTWAVEWRRGGLRLALGSGIAVTSEVFEPKLAEDLAVRPGDVVALLVGARDGDHSCDLTAVDLSLAALESAAPSWDLAADITPDVLAGNPHADARGAPGIWHFGSEPDVAGDAAIRADSLLGKWLLAENADERQQLTAGVADAAQDDPRLAWQLGSFDSPLYRGCRADDAAASLGDERYGLGPERFDAGGSLHAHAPEVVAIRVPAELAAGREFVATGALDASDGSVQLRVSTDAPKAESLLPAAILVNEAGSARRRFESACDAFRELFPAALCYPKIVPVDEAVTLILYHREDERLVRLMLDDSERARLDRLWTELHFVAQDAITLVDVYDQLWQYATQDADPKVFEPMREPIRQRAADFRAELTAAEPKQLEAVLEFAGRAYRRPLTATEGEELRQLYRKLRAEELPHDAALRLLLARVLIAPAFLYRSEEPGPAREAAPVSALELATRLSFFLWSSVPDEPLRAAAQNGKLTELAELRSQVRRMLADPRARRLAEEFGCSWLHLRGFDESSEKSERFFPTFRELRGPMYTEAVELFSDFFQHDRALPELVESDFTFLNGALAEHYGIPGVRGSEWRRVDGVRQYGRGGILGLAATLASQSGASRTSPILRGNWVAEVLLGDRLPRPPKDVPKLPEEETTETLTVRQLVEQHRADPRCAHCHERIDSFGFALEGFDAIGRRRERDLGGRPIDTRATALDGTAFEGIDGLRHYLLTERRAAFEKQFCRKLLGYALGRAVQLTDEALLQRIQAEWPAHEQRVGWLIEQIVCSPQFLEVRGRQWSDTDTEAK